ncbi:MAG: hypothetical protein ACXWP5_13640 [Bdellovibrionota bacterium]
MHFPLLALPALLCSLSSHPSQADDAIAPENQPWDKVAHELITAAGADLPLEPVLRSGAPSLFRQIKTDSLHRTLQDLWGRSINYDEFAKEQIVHPAILETIREAMGVTVTPFAHPKFPQETIFHAGMEHTYGYLFSIVKTPFGFKRARWVQGEIEKGFGLPDEVLNPRTPAGTLFSNVTYFAGRIAFAGDAPLLAKLESDASSVAIAVRKFPYAKLRPVRLEEVITAMDKDGRSREVILRTDLVPFFNHPADPKSDAQLLVYSVVDPSEGGAHLITAFPVADSFADGIFAAGTLGDAKPVTTHYNGFVYGVSDAPGSIAGVRRKVGASAK